jgi:hypothetical protein
MTQAISILFRWWAAGRLEVMIAAADAVGLQVLLAVLLEHCYRRN